MIDTIRNFPEITILSYLKFSLSFFFIFIIPGYSFLLLEAITLFHRASSKKGCKLKFFQKFTRLLLQDAYSKNYPTRKSTNIPNLFKKPIQDGAWSSNEISSIFAFLYLAATTTRHNCVWSRNLSARRINLERNLY